MASATRSCCAPSWMLRSSRRRASSCAVTSRCRFVSGVDDESIGYAAESLRLLRAEIMRRTERLKALPRELCPDKRVTRQIAARASHRLRPIACIIDEAQNLFAHPDHGKAAGLDAEF